MEKHLTNADLLPISESRGVESYIICELFCHWEHRRNKASVSIETGWHECTYAESLNKYQVHAITFWISQQLWPHHTWLTNNIWAEFLPLWGTTTTGQGECRMQYSLTLPRSTLLTTTILHTTLSRKKKLEQWVQEDNKQKDLGSEGAFTHNHHSGWVVVQAHFQPWLRFFFICTQLLL